MKKLKRHSTMHIKRRIMFTLLLRILFPMLMETKAITKKMKSRAYSTISATGYLSNLAL
jgi:hypothetical protein